MQQLRSQPVSTRGPLFESSEHCTLTALLAKRRALHAAGCPTGRADDYISGSKTTFRDCCAALGSVLLRSSLLRSLLLGSSRRRRDFARTCHLYLPDFQTLVLGCIEVEFLHVNTRVKAFDEIYKVYRLLHRSDFNISMKKSFEFLKMKILFSTFRIFQNCPQHSWPCLSLILMNFYRNLAELLPHLSENTRIYRNLQKLCQILRTIFRSNFQNFRNSQKCVFQIWISH